jgi:hypothetical protein
VCIYLHVYCIHIYIYTYNYIYIYAQRLGFAWKHKSFFWPRLLRRKAWVKNMCHWTGAHTSQICYHNIPTYTNVESEVREIYVNSIRLLNGWMEWPRNFWTHMDAVDSTSWLLGLLPNPQLAWHLESGAFPAANPNLWKHNPNMALSGRIPWKKSGFLLIQVWFPNMIDILDIFHGYCSPL